MSTHTGKICPFCRTEILEAESVTVCPACGIAHHTGCWEENKGCTTFGCSEQHYEEQHTNPTDVCANCGGPLGEGQAFCPKCGTAKNEGKKNVCGKCGFELQDDQAFCPKCGQKAGLAVDAGVNAAINQFNETVEKAKKNKKTPLIIVAVAVVIVLVFALGVSKGPDFDALYDDYCASTWANVGSDGSYLYIDTNPYDWEDDGLAYPAAYTAVKAVNEALGLPESLYNEMGSTTGNDGKQTETFDDQGVTVSWKYHPDCGLEVTYKKAK